MVSNKYGLSRRIPFEIKEAVRRRDGFGCVICGLAIIEYEHVDPEFKNAKKHEVGNITLLCHQCHGKVTRGFLSKNTVKESMLNPKCKQRGFSREILDYTNESKIILAGNKFALTQIPLQVNDTPIIFIKPGSSSEPAKLNAVFFESNSSKILEIKDNELNAFTDNFDIETTGGKLIIKASSVETSIILDFKTSSPDVIIEELKMNIYGNKIVGTKDVLDVNGNQFSNCIVSNCKVGFQIGRPADKI